MGGAGFIAIIYPNIISAFGFVGGTGAVFIAITFPFAVYVKESKDKWYSAKNLFVTFMNIVISSAGMVAAVISVLDAAEVLDLSSY